LQVSVAIGEHQGNDGLEVTHKGWAALGVAVCGLKSAGRGAIAGARIGQSTLCVQVASGHGIRIQSQVVEDLKVSI